MFENIKELIVEYLCCEPDKVTLEADIYGMFDNI